MSAMDPTMVLSEVVDTPEALAGRAMELARAVAAHAPLALRATKEATRCLWETARGARRRPGGDVLHQRRRPGGRGRLSEPPPAAAAVPLSRGAAEPGREPERRHAASPETGGAARMAGRVGWT